ncbi:MAG: phospholipase [Planctomycetes bacterium]|nr:phospholipase [Planctomycetota bacterium]
MNRSLLLVFVVSTIAAAQPIHGFVEKQVAYTGGAYKDEVFRYRLRSPSTVEKGKRYPLVFFLHGAGERGDDNEKQMRHFPELWGKSEYAKAFDCFVLAPQCRVDKRWVEVPWGDGPSLPLPKEPSHQMRAALLAYEATLKAYPIDEDRIYLTGLSMGGYGTWYLAARYPGRFAAVAPICGGGPEARAAAFKDVKLWAWHGDEDRAVPVSRTRRMIAAIKKAGGKPRYTELEGVKHDSWVQAYRPRAVLPWMFKQKR